MSSCRGGVVYHVLIDREQFRPPYRQKCPWPDCLFWFLRSGNQGWPTHFHRITVETEAGEKRVKVGFRIVGRLHGMQNNLRITFRITDEIRIQVSI